VTKLPGEVSLYQKETVKLETLKELRRNILGLADVLRREIEDKEQDRERDKESLSIKPVGRSA
jgi:hypothetical protein